MAVPHEREQSEIGQILDWFDQQMEAENRELVKLTRLKSGLMSDLLTGRVRVPPSILQEES